MDIRGFLNLGNLYSKINEFEKAEIVYRKGKCVVEKDAFRNRRITALHITLLLRLSQLLSKDASKAEQRKKVHEQALLLSALSSPHLTRANHQNAFQLNNKFNEDILDADDLYNLAIITQENGAILDALRLFDLALQRYPHHESSLLASARIIYEQRLSEQYGVGIERLRQVIEMGKASDVVYFQLGMLSIKSADFETATQALNAAIEMNANFSEALYNLALLHYNRNALNASSAILHRLLTVDSEHTKGTMLSCDIQAEFYRDFFAAERCYRKVLSFDADNATVKHNICVLFVHTSRAASVSVCLERRLWSDATFRDQEMRRNKSSQTKADTQKLTAKSIFKQLKREENILLRYIKI
ncbi:transmembrane and TPR repeat-containing protein-like protein [Leptotrombidium deliense]|uniref:Transmembrane and TPR repeat-containing protein-like protein n=1 Tax=Leptotrombidium deliense TaxID=299467 RepID=A0A443SSE4_9ACAR|nr:transmembrane and TPR repeat-containing protein-like protein [Leptotrombidium deliense]